MNESPSTAHRTAAPPASTGQRTNSRRLLITAGPTEPVAFAREIFRLLGVYEGEVLDAWYRLFHDSDAEAYAVLEKAAAQ